MSKKPDITLYFLQATRCIRIAWLLEELNLDYKVEFYDRQWENQPCPPEYKDDSGNVNNRAPSIRDGDLSICESGAILEYICDYYDPNNQIIPGLDKPVDRVKVQQWLHAAEGMFMMHGWAIVNARWFAPPRAQENGDARALEDRIGWNIKRDLQWLDDALAESKSGWIVGDRITAADIMLQISVRWVLVRELGLKNEDADYGGKWVHMRKWLEKCEGSESYKRAVKRTGHSLVLQGVKR